MCARTPDRRVGAGASGLHRDTRRPRDLWRPPWHRRGGEARRLSVSGDGIVGRSAGTVGLPLRECPAPARTRVTPRRHSQSRSRLSRSTPTSASRRRPSRRRSSLPAKLHSSSAIRDRLEALLTQIEALPLGQRSAFLRAHVARSAPGSRRATNLRSPSSVRRGDGAVSRDRDGVLPGGRLAGARRAARAAGRPTNASRSPWRLKRSSMGFVRFPGSSEPTGLPSTPSRPPDGGARLSPRCRPWVSRTRPSARTVIAS